MTLSFSFPAPAKRLSSNDRLHWARKAGLTSLWRQTGHHYARFHRDRWITPPVPVNILVTFEVTDPNRRRDPMNAWPTVKALTDGMVADAGMLPDDDSRWVTIVQPEFVKGANRVRVDITPRSAS